MRKILLALMLAAAPVAAQNTTGVQTDVPAVATLDLTVSCPITSATADCPAGSVYEMPIGNGQGVVGADIIGLTGSGATVMVDRSIGGSWSGRNLLVTGSAGAFASTVSQDTSFTLNSVASRTIRFRVQTAGTGTARVYASATANSSIVQFATSLPAGSLTIGKTIIPDGAATSALQQSTLTALGSPLQQGGSVSITGPVATTQSGPWNVGINGTVPVSGTLATTQSGSWNVGVTALPVLPAGTNTIGNVGINGTVPVSGTLAATQSGPWSVGLTGTLPAFAATPTFNLGALGGAATAALQMQISGQLPASLGSKAGAASLSVVPNTDTPFPVTGTVTIQDANGGTLDTAETPSTVATVGLAPVVTTNATALLVKASAGNLYTAELTAGGTAGYLVAVNLAAIPASGATISGALLRCITAPANLTASSGSGIPFRASTGIVLLFSTSCTTYTPVGTAAISILGRAM